MDDLIHKVVILQPPLVQLNTPYPSGAYLSSFFKMLQNFAFLSDSSTEKKISIIEELSSILSTENKELLTSIGKSIESVEWIDLSNLFIHELFSRSGLSKLFELSTDTAYKIIFDAEKKGNTEVAFNLRRYVSNSQSWIDWIDRIVLILTGKGREVCHEFVRSAYVPRGARMEHYIENLNREVNVDDAIFLASFALADLADYITTVFDENFALIRYAESLSASTATFDEIYKASYAPVMQEFYEPLVIRVLQNIYTKVNKEESVKYLFCVSVPFAGTFAPALCTCRVIRKVFGDLAIISLGGGYINTELRDVTKEKEPKFFSLIDCVSYDRGYASYIDLLQNIISKKQVQTIQENIETFRDIEDFFTQQIIPDYSDIDFSQYLQVADDTNPMHRIWSDGAWIKAYLAHGCYWHKCAFCDTTLDYVCKYKMVNIKHLCEGLIQQAHNKGVYGIHFVDEAAPPVALCKFALENCYISSQKRLNKLSFWGNIRFEKAFTRDIADILAFSGLIGVSGGIEIASNEGLASVNKGISIQSLVSSLAAFKEAGVLVHAYMIYGFYKETPQMIIDSAETLRQLFKTGLLDSSFWHKFTLTDRSTLFAEWKEGLHPDLNPKYPQNNSDSLPFVKYEMHFTGEKVSNKYSAPLVNALEDYMHGCSLDKPVNKYFPFDMPKPTVPRDLIEKAITVYEKERDIAFNQNIKSGQYVWLGGKFSLSKNNKFTHVHWMYMGELLYADIPYEISVLENVTNLIWDMSPVNGVPFTRDVSYIPDELFKAVRGRGLAKL